MKKKKKHEKTSHIFIGNIGLGLYKTVFYSIFDYLIYFEINLLGSKNKMIL